MKEIKNEWCENFIRKTFEQRKITKAIECSYFFKLAERAHLYEKETYGSPMSQALEKLTYVKTITIDGAFAYNVFVLKN